ncbi:sugar ABC transporter permease [Candidatus Bipolaricaulota bacterium]|nr:sugar ABC transporter permease [Candidatus Bipolaricaulota bacterium]
MARTIWVSFTHKSIGVPAPTFVGIRNYAELLRNPDVWQGFQNTIQFTFITVLIETLLGFGIAMLFNSNRVWGGSIALTLILTPMMLSRAVIFTFWRYMYNPMWGIINYLLSFLGVGRISWLSRSDTAFTATMITEIWMWTPFMIIICLAGLSSVPDRLYEAASVDRASGWFKFWHITLPLAMPIIMIGILFRLIDALKVFGQIWGLTGKFSSTPSATLMIYRKAFEQFNMGKAAAIAYVLLIISISLSNIIITRINRMKG